MRQPSNPKAPPPMPKVSNEPQSVGLQGPITGYRVQWALYEAAWHYEAYTHEEVSAIDIYRALAQDRCARWAKVTRISDSFVIAQFSRPDRRDRTRH